MSNVTIYDVAREANVSMATVSRVVNGNPNVKPTTRKRCLKPSSVLAIVPMPWQGVLQVKNDNCRRDYTGHLQHLLF